jgi:hypothetical protein
MSAVNGASSAYVDDGKRFWNLRQAMKAAALEISKDLV